VRGVWEGQASDFYVEDGMPGVEFDARINFEVKGRKVTGVLTIGANNTNVDLVLDGGFYNDDYIQLTYRSVSHERRQLGVIVLKLSR